MENTTQARVTSYWTRRAADFAAVRRAELRGSLRERWLTEILPRLPKANTALKVLDVGTGAGFFALIMALNGHNVTGIDLTPAMISEARGQAEAMRVRANFHVMDAAKTRFPDQSFDVVLSRNLTWTLQDSAAAYAEWRRVLRPGGVLLNFDANYGRHEKARLNGASEAKASRDRACQPAQYGHVGMTPELERENAAITLSMDICKEDRPTWDVCVLRGLMFRDVRADAALGQRVLGEIDLPDAPMFIVSAVK